MGRSKIPHKFGSIPKTLWDKIPGKGKQFLYKYDYHRKKMVEIDEEIEELKIDIEEKKKEKEKHRRKSEEIYKNNKNLKSDYSVSFNISKNDKKIKDKIHRYWLVNIKFKGMNNPIHIGIDDFVKDYIKNDKWLNENMSIPKKLSEDDIRSCIDMLVRDSIDDLVTSGENLFDKTIRFTDLVD